MQVADIEKAEKDKMKAKVEKIIGHGINCFINRQLIYNYPEELFADAGVMAIEHADFDGIERLGLVTGTSSIPCAALEELDLGSMLLQPDQLFEFLFSERVWACWALGFCRLCNPECMQLLPY